MNKKQIFIVWTALFLITSMVWFPGRWFDYIVEGYPTIKPDSLEFLVRIVTPVSIITLWMLYLLRERKTKGGHHTSASEVGTGISSLFKSALVMTLGILLGLSIGFYLLKSRVYPAPKETKESGRVQLENDAFRDFCKSEGYREELEELIHWLKEKKAHDIAVLYNADDAYSTDIYKNFSQKVKGEKMHIVFSDMFKVGERSFYNRLQIIESLKPEAIVFLGTYRERIAFLENISNRSQLAFWESRLDKIKWIE